MFEFFAEIIGYAGAAFQFLLNFINSIITAFVFVTNSLTFTVSLVGFVPAIIGSGIVITIGVCVMKFVVGR